jgi:transposase-like protein
MKLPKTLIEAVRYFSDEQVCIDVVADMRWPDGKVICPDCKSGNPYYLASQKRWKCRKGTCNRQFSVKVGTIFEDSPISLKKWLPAMWLICNCKNGISSHELARDLKVTQKTAWFMLQRIRLAMAGGSFEKMGGPEGGPVEVDEAYIGGDPKNRHRSKRPKARAASVPRLIQDENGKTIINPASKMAVGRVSDKIPVMGMLDREARKVRAKVIPQVKREVLQSVILENITKGSTVYTDMLAAYSNLKTLDFVHDTVTHVEEYVRGNVHTNGIENFWSLLKRGLKGTYVAVEPFHLDRYIGEQVFRFNNRATKDNPLTDSDRFALALSQIVNKRLTYAELTGKDEERPEEKF